MEYVNTACNQRGGENGVQGVDPGCGKVKCFRNKPPSFSPSSRKDKTSEAYVLGFSQSAGMF